MNLSTMLNPVEDEEPESMDIDTSTRFERPASSTTQAMSHKTLLPLKEVLQGIASSPEFQSQPPLVVEDTLENVEWGGSHQSSTTHSPQSIYSSDCSYPTAQGQPTWISTKHPGSGRNEQRRSSNVTEFSSMSDDDASSPSTQIHNNNKYTVEMIDWIRYHRVDRGLPWEAELFPRFFEQFPERYHPKATVQTLTSRYYRDNTVVELDENGKWQLDEKGHLKLQFAKVRGRSTVVGKDIPRSLVDKWPARLLTYTSWESPVLEQDRERARRILAGNDPTDPHGRKAEWRRILNSCEHLLYSERRADANNSS